jgi:hypothetical protein
LGGAFKDEAQHPQTDEATLCWAAELFAKGDGKLFIY